MQVSRKTTLPMAHSSSFMHLNIFSTFFVVPDTFTNASPYFTQDCSSTSRVAMAFGVAV